MISRESIREFFRDNASRGIELRREMLWGFFLIGKDPKKLERIRPLVHGLGYRYVRVFEPDPQEIDPIYFLHVERVEVHSAESLFRRTQELDGVAKKHGLIGLDGFDVGNVDGSPLT